MMYAFQQNTMERIESVVKQTNEMVLQTVSAQLTGMKNTTIKNMSTEGDAKFKKQMRDSPQWKQG